MIKRILELNENNLIVSLSNWSEQIRPINKVINAMNDHLCIADNSESSLDNAESSLL